MEFKNDVLQPAQSSRTQTRRSSTALSLGTKQGIASNMKLNFDDFYKQLKSFKDAKGHIAVPFLDETRALAVSTKEMWEIFPTLQDPEKKRKLESLGFYQETHKEKNARIWNKRFSALKAYKEQKGDCNVPAKYITENGFALGKWVASQRRAKKNEKLAKEREDKLRSLEFVWEVDEHKDKSSWDDKFELLRAYKEQCGHAKVPKDHKVGAVALGQWVANQRRAKKNEKLRKDREKKLKGIDFVWEVQTATKRERSVDNADAEPRQKLARLDEVGSHGKTTPFASSINENAASLQPSRARIIQVTRSRSGARTSPSRISTAVHHQMLGLFSVFLSQLTAVILLVQRTPTIRSQLSSYRRHKIPSRRSGVSPVLSRSLVDHHVESLERSNSLRLVLLSKKSAEQSSSPSRILNSPTIGALFFPSSGW